MRSSFQIIFLTATSLAVLKLHLSPEAGLLDIAPTQPSNGALPDGLTKPPLSPSISDCCRPDMVLDILLLNVSDTPSWNMFLNEFASQFGLLPHQIELINFYIC
ncbi:Protein kinase superfamily protein [Raphanus sativus]|nr:Protein kinase superfamily protein [Raphanus sativus]